MMILSQRFCKNESYLFDRKNSFWLFSLNELLLTLLLITLLWFFISLYYLLITALTSLYRNLDNRLFIVWRVCNLIFLYVLKQRRNNY